MRITTRALFAAALLAISLGAQSPDADRDGDGLSDFHERFKYGTNPSKADSDGDGTPDGDWLERREYAYVVRAVVHVMKPVTIEYLNDDYQDARLLDDAGDYVELEVILYPFNSVREALRATPEWRKTPKALSRWVEPGPSSDWTPKLRRKILAALKKDGIDVKKLDDRETAERVSKWLLDRAEHEDGFTSFITAFDDKGRPFVPEDLREGAEESKAEKSRTLEEQWEREVSAAGMFKHKTRGSCTSSAIYLNGCLRAVGLPTRTILCIPLVDASDPEEIDLIRRGIKHNGVRKLVEGKASSSTNAWTSHTFNDVWVGGRWRRLNYHDLGQNILDEQFLGLMIHTGTFHDWADARMPETVGRRQKGRDQRRDVFGGRNPYSTIALRDIFGPHCKIENPTVEEDVLTVERMHWTDAKELPEGIRESCAKKGRFGLMARVIGLQSSGHLREFMSVADNRVFLEARDGSPSLKVGFDPGCWWIDGDKAWVYIGFGRSDRENLRAGVEYRVTAANRRDGYEWLLPERLRVARRR